MAQTRARPAPAERHTITGPGVDRTVDGPARMVLAMAQQAASHIPAGQSLYVRDGDGVALYRVDQLADGTTVSYALVEPEGPHADIAAYDRARGNGRRHR